MHLNQEEVKLKVYDKEGSYKNRRNAQKANVASLNKKEINIFLSLDLLDSIDLYLIPIVQDGKYGFINKMASIIIDPVFDEIDGSFYTAESYVVVRKDKRWSAIDSTGKELLPYIYTKIFPSPDSNLVTCCDYDGKSVIDLKTGNVIVESGIYDIIEGFRYGFARVKNNGKWGIINSNGKLVLDTQYEKVQPWHEWYEPTTIIRKTKDGRDEKRWLNDFDK